MRKKYNKKQIKQFCSSENFVAKGGNGVVIESSKVFREYNLKKKGRVDLVNSSTLQKVVTVEKDAPTIFEKLTLWTEDTINKVDGNEFVYNKEDLTISGHGSRFFKIGVQSTEFYFDFIIEIQDNKYRVTIDDVYFNNADSETGSISKYALLDNELQLFNNELYDIEFINSMTNAINNDVNSDW